MVKILAIKSDGTLSYCSSPQEMRGRGRCNHIDHQKEGESIKEFMDRTGNNKTSIENTSLFKEFKKLEKKNEEYNKNDKVLKTFNEVYNWDDLKIEDIKILPDTTDLKINYIIDEYRKLERDGKIEEENEEDLLEVIKTYKSILTYGKMVTDFDDESNEIRRQFTNDEYKERYHSLDAKRRLAHNEVMSQIRIMNGLNKLYGLKPFYDKSTKDENRRDVTEDILKTLKSNIENYKKGA